MSGEEIMPFKGEEHGVPAFTWGECENKGKKTESQHAEISPRFEPDTSILQL
jgi:hypothetical protein